MGFPALIVVFEELGRAAAGGPFLSTGALAIGAFLEAGTDAQRAAWLPGVASGAVRATVALTDAGGRLGSDLVLTTGTDGAMTVDGRAGFVTDAPLAELLVVAARTPDGEDALAVVPRAAQGVEVTRVPVLDLTRSLGHVTLKSCPLGATDLLAVGAPATRAIASLRTRAAVAIAADAVGVARAVLARTTQYACERRQFGLPIGAFQGVKHQCADMFVGTETAAALVRAAAAAIEDGEEQAGELASMAKLAAGGNGGDAAGRAMQLHGGIGYTWEHDAHIYLKRAKLDEALFGDRAHHLRVIADHLLGPAHPAREAVDAGIDAPFGVIA
jgi:alkylation response protein AidB-like acyl-CoA dehydrogenase